MRLSDSARILRVASRPLMPGRFTSMRTRSGSSSSAFVTESSPVSDSPTTSNPSVASTTMRAARRNGSWSSTISTRTVTGGSPSERKGLTPRALGKGCQHDFYRGGPLPGRALRSGRRGLAQPEECLLEEEPRVQVEVLREGRPGLLERPEGGRPSGDIAIELRPEVQVDEAVGVGA